MKTDRIPVDPFAPAPAVITRAAEVLRTGGLVAIPTETVYGLAALADDPTAVARIFAAKGRPSTNPIIVHVFDAPAARVLTRGWPASAAALSARFWPGALTLVLPRDASHVPDGVTGGGSTVALRSPSHPVARALLAALGRPLAAPSANPFQSLTATTADHVLKGLDGRIEMVLDAGPCEHGIESTVVDLSVEPPTLLRPGAIALAALQSVVPAITVRTLFLPDDRLAPSPGLIRKHYAPRATLRVVAESSLAIVAATTHGPVGVVTRHPVDLPNAMVRELPTDPIGYTAGLFAALHDLDDRGCANILVVDLPPGPDWHAVRDRLARAGA